MVEKKEIERVECMVRGGRRQQGKKKRKKNKRK